MTFKDIEGSLAEMFYEYISKHGTREQRGLLIHELLSCEDMSQQTHNVIVELAMIHAAQEGN